MFGSDYRGLRMMNWRRSKNIMRTQKRMKSNFWISLNSMSFNECFKINIVQQNIIKASSDNDLKFLI